MRTDPETAQPASPPFILVASIEKFEEMMGTLVRALRMAVDIEADSLYHYYEKVCLFQVSTDGQTYVIDPLSVRHLAPLGRLMADPAREKVFHAAPYDLLCMRRDYGFDFRNIFDTHVAAQLLGYEQLGLSMLLERLLGISHSKHRQRDDWSRRPLEPEQLEYAAADTHYLLHLRDILDRELRSRDRHSWAQEEFQHLLGAAPQERTFDPEGFRRIKGARDLSQQQLAVLRALYLLRDRYARLMDLPPFKVLNNITLLDLARKPPLYPRELLRRPGIAARLAQRFGGEIFQTIRRAHAGDTDGPRPQEQRAWRPFAPEAQSRLDRLKAWRRSKARELGLPVGVVFPGSLLEILAAAPLAETAGLSGIEGMHEWRVREFGREILDVLGR